MNYVRKGTEIYSMKIKIVETSAEKEAVLDIRRTVFIQEQKIPEPIEIDENEEKATYVLATIDKRPVGTFRWRRASIIGGARPASRANRSCKVHSTWQL